MFTPYDYFEEPTNEVLTITLTQREGGARSAVARYAAAVAIGGLIVEAMRPGTGLFLVFLLSPGLLASYFGIRRRFQTFTAEQSRLSGTYQPGTVFDNFAEWDLPRSEVLRVTYARRGWGVGGGVFLETDNPDSPRRCVLNLPLQPSRRRELAELIANELVVPCEECGETDFRIT